MKDILQGAASLIVSAAIGAVALGAFVGLSMWGVLKYTEERWGVEGVENLIDTSKSLGLAILVLVVFATAWFLIDRSYRAGGRVATDAMRDTVDGIGVAVEFFTESQKSQQEAVKSQRIAAEAGAARSKAESAMDLEGYKWQIEQQRLAARQQHQIESHNLKLTARQQAADEAERRRYDEQEADAQRIRNLPWNIADTVSADDADDSAPRFRRLY